MHVQLPKPLHGWREFAGEVGIIVLGVLIALGAQQVAEEINLRQQLHQSNRAMELELGESVGQAILRIDAEPCIEQRLDGLAGVVDEAAATHRLQPVGLLPTPQYFTWPSGTWQSFSASDVANRESREQLQALSGVYDFIADLNAEQRAELDAWTRVFQLVGPGRDFDAADARDARAAIADARKINRMIGMYSIRMVQLIRAYDIPFDQASVELYLDDPTLIEQPGRCRPMGGPVDHYGEAPLKNSMANLRAHPLEKPR